MGLARRPRRPPPRPPAARRTRPRAALPRAGLGDDAERQPLAGTSAAASSISARTGVMPRVPMISALVISAPSQCERSMISWPATPGKKYLLPPEKPDHLVREHRADDERDVVLDDRAVEPHVDGFVQQAVRTARRPASAAMRAERDERGRVRPLVVAHRHRPDSARRSSPAG